MLAGHLDAQPTGRLEVEAQIAAPLIVAGRVLGRELSTRLQVRPRAKAAAAENLQPGQEIRHRGRGRHARPTPVGGPVEGIGALHGPILAGLQHVRGPSGDDVDHPAHGVGAVERRRSSPNHLHALHDLGVHGGEVLARTLAEGAVVEAHAIDHQQYLASGEGAHEGGPLPRGRLLYQHAGLGDKGIEEKAVRLFAQFGAPHQVDRDREFVGGGGQTGRGHDQRIQLDGRRVRIRCIRRRLRHGGRGSGEGGRPRIPGRRPDGATSASQSSSCSCLGCPAPREAGEVSRDGPRGDWMSRSQARRRRRNSPSTGEMFPDRVRPRRCVRHESLDA